MADTIKKEIREKGASGRRKREEFEEEEETKR